MKIKFILITITILCFSLLIFLIPGDCKSLNAFKSLSDFKGATYYDCISSKTLKKNISIKLSKYPILLNFIYKVLGKQNPDNSFGLYAKNKKIPFKNENKNSDDKYFQSEYLDEIGLIKKNNLTFNLNNESHKINEIYNSWEKSHSNNWNSKFLNKHDINQKNIAELKLVWKHQFSNKKNWKENIEVNPIFVDGKIIYISADWKINVIDAENGSVVWSKQFIFKPTRRGITYYKDHIFVTSGFNLFKIKIKNGNLDKNFGNNGKIFVGNVLIAPNINDNQIILANVKGDISSYDFSSGQKLFSIPINTDKKVVGAFAWAGAALDEKKMFYYASIGNPKPSLYGGKRPGNNKNSSSLICINLDKKKIEWSFQETSHDLWDYDVSSPPILATLNFNEKLIDAVIVTTKRGNVLIFDRYNGNPVFDLNYQKPPESNVPGEIVSDKQLKLKEPEKFSKIEFDLNDLDLQSLDNKKLEYFLNETTYGWLKPPTIGKDLIVYGVHGGNNWFGSAFNPYSHNIFIPSNNIAYVLRVQPKSKEKKVILKNSYLKLYNQNCASCHGNTRNGQIKLYREHQKKYIPPLVGYSHFKSLKKKMNYENYFSKHSEKISKTDFDKIVTLFKKWDDALLNNEKIYMDNYWTKLLNHDGEFLTKPPYGEIISLNSLNGKINWKKAWGYKVNKDNKEIRLGAMNNGGISINKGGLIFANGTTDSYAIILSQKTGEEIWKFKMSAPGSAPPLLYRYKNRDYVSFLSTGLNFHNSKEGNSTLYTFSLN